MNTFHYVLKGSPTIVFHFLAAELSLPSGKEDAVKRVYRGKLVLAQDDVHGPKDILYLIDPKSPEHLSYCEDHILARQVARDMGRYGRYLSIQYWTSDKVIGERKIQKAFLDWLEGVGDANYSVTYTETSGYLWTTEQLQVGRA